jgi:hypothetical protein
MRQIVPAPVIAIVAEVTSTRETHATLDSLFIHAGASGDPPEGSKHAKALEWLRRTNRDENIKPLEVLGKIIEGYMEEELNENGPSWEREFLKDINRIQQALQNAQLQYSWGGKIIGVLASPSKSLEKSISARDIPSLNEEFERALSSVEVSPRDGLSAACNILESVCKVYIEDEGLEMPSKQDLQPVWTVVRKDLGFDPSKVEDDDLKKILSGLISIVDGVGAIRTHASSAHGAGKKRYRVESRHARLSIHASHTVVSYILESWDKKKTKDMD